MTFCTEGRTAHLPRLQTRKPNLKVECLETQLFVMRLEALGRRAACTTQGTHNHDRCEKLFLPLTLQTPAAASNQGEGLAEWKNMTEIQSGCIRNGLW